MKRIFGHIINVLSWLKASGLESALWGWFQSHYLTTPPPTIEQPLKASSPMSSLSFTTTGQDFPEGTIAGNFSVWILNSLGTVIASQTIPNNTTTATFTVPPGTYTASVQLTDSNGNPLGSTANSAPFTVAAVTGVTVTLQVPLVVTVTP